MPRVSTTTTRALRYEVPQDAPRLEPTEEIPARFRHVALNVLTAMRHQVATGAEFLPSDEVAVRELWNRSSLETRAVFLSDGPVPSGIADTLWTTVIQMRRVILT